MESVLEGITIPKNTFYHEMTRNLNRKLHIRSTVSCLVSHFEENFKKESVHAQFINYHLAHVLPVREDLVCIPRKLKGFCIKYSCFTRIVVSVLF